MQTLISLDPGLSSGIAIGTYSATEPYQRTHAFQIEGGLSGFLENSRVSENGYGDKLFYVRHLGVAADICFGEEGGLTVICEKFTPRQSLTLASAEPLRIEGALVAQGVMPDYTPGKKNPLWCQPAQQYFSGGTDLKTRKKAAYDFLRKHGLYLTGKQVGCKDAHDAMSATLHAISWLRRQRHEPTLKHYFKENE